MIMLWLIIITHSVHQPWGCSGRALATYKRTGFLSPSPPYPCVLMVVTHNKIKKRALESLLQQTTCHTFGQVIRQRKHIQGWNNMALQRCTTGAVGKAKGRTRTKAKGKQMNGTESKDRSAVTGKMAILLFCYYFRSIRAKIICA